VGWDAGVVLGIIGIFLAVGGLGVALPPFIQMWHGRPDFDFGVDTFPSPGGKTLFITLKNKMTTSRFLKAIGVTRDTADVDASFSIQQQGTNHLVAHLVSGLLHNSALKETGLMLRAFPGRTIGLSIVHVKGDTAFIIDARATDYQIIAPGYYVVDAAFICGERVFHVSKNLRIGSQIDLTIWY
jgi:hypothetical protein